ncbi:hypothetical protein Metho_2503 (plasmid) [Methanomethylovorans hollandica DSM 15978]|uniref:Uncharacterized protein n=1 Tax=Methanomethylovorans hollandica (strain DSM 15978 / NBRC 107637 / DMS1) TaxID=867904 RepID=L0L2J5_METHD|nr:hypothetical protein [Methanomethylovorans hollandica]AGB50643.1 hypothetical protein Metho_2503 [Methanomethylovorans hollandica DSM 15978]
MKNNNLFIFFVLLIYLSTFLQPCLAETTENTNTIDITNDLMAMAVAASVAPKEDLSVIYKNYYSMHSRLAEVYLQNGYMPTTIDNQNRVINKNHDDTALIQFILANALLTKSYETNEQASDEEKDIISKAWINIGKTNIGSSLQTILTKQMILKGYVIEQETEYDATLYKDVNDFHETAKNEFIIESAEDEAYLKKQYYSAFSDYNQFEMDKTSESSEDYREFKLLTEENKVLTEELEKYSDLIEIIKNTDGTIEYVGSDEEVERYQAIEDSLEENTERLTEILDKYEMSSSFKIESFALIEGNQTKEEDEDKVSVTYLTVPLDKLIDLSYQKHESYMIWSSVIYSAYQINEPFMTSDEWVLFNNYVVQNEAVRTIEKELYDINARIKELQNQGDNIITPEEANASKEDLVLDANEEKELKELRDKRTKLKELKKDYSTNLDNYKEENNINSVYLKSDYYYNGIAPFANGYYDWNLIDTVASSLYLSAYNQELKYSNGLYSASPTTLSLKEVENEDSNSTAEIESLNQFCAIYVNANERLSKTISSYPDFVEMYSSDQLADLYLAKADFYLNSIKNSNIRNAVYLAAIQEARIQCMSIPHKKVFLSYDSDNKPSVEIYYTKSVDIETLKNVLNRISENPNIDEESAIIANWNENTNAEYLIKQSYGTASILAADVAINNLINERMYSPYTIPITTADLSALTQNPLITEEQSYTIHTLLNSNAVEIAKSNNTLIQELRMQYVDMYYDPIVPAIQDLLKEIESWPNDDSTHQVNTNNLVQLTTQIDTFMGIYDSLPDAQKSNYTIPYDSKNLIPLLQAPSTKYTLAKTIVDNNIQVSDDFRKQCESIVKEYESNKLKKTAFTVVACLAAVLLVGAMAYKFWYKRLPNFKMKITEATAEYNIVISNRGQKPAIFEKNISFNTNIVPPTLTDNKVMIVNIGEKGFTLKGSLGANETKTIPVKKKDYTLPGLEDKTDETTDENENIDQIMEIINRGENNE